MRARIGAALLALPLAITLAGCDTNATIEIAEDASASISLDLLDNTDLFTSQGLTCDMANALLGGGDGVTITDEEYEADGHTGCKLTITGEDALDGETLIDNGDSFTLKLTGDDFGVSEDDLAYLGDEVDFHLDVVMPGDITEATNGGVIDGNKAGYDSLDILTSGFSVTGGKTPASGGSGMGTIGKILLAVLALALIAGLLIFFLTRSKKETDSNAGAYAAGAAAAGAAAAGGAAAAHLSGSAPAEGTASLNVPDGPSAPAVDASAEVPPVPALGHPDDSGVPQPKFDGDATAPVVDTDVPTVDVNADVPAPPEPVLDAPSVDAEAEAPELSVEAEAPEVSAEAPEANAPAEAPKPTALGVDEEEREGMQVTPDNVDIVESEADAELSAEEDSEVAAANEAKVRHHGAFAGEAERVEEGQIQGEAASFASEADPSAPSAAAGAAAGLGGAFESLRGKVNTESVAGAFDTLKAKAGEAGDKATEAFDSLRERAGEVFEGDDMAPEGSAEATGAFDQLKKKAAEARDKATEALQGDGEGESAFDQLKKKASEARDKATEALQGDGEGESAFDQLKKKASEARDKATEALQGDGEGESAFDQLKKKASEARDKAEDYFKGEDGEGAGV